MVNVISSIATASKSRVATTTKKTSLPETSHAIKWSNEQSSKWDCLWPDELIFHVIGPASHSLDGSVGIPSGR